MRRGQHKTLYDVYLVTGRKRSMASRTRGSWVSSCTSLPTSKRWPSGWPAPDEARAFESDLAQVREALSRLRDDVLPPEDFDAQPS